MNLPRFLCCLLALAAFALPAFDLSAQDDPRQVMSRVQREFTAATTPRAKADALLRCVGVDDEKIAKFVIGIADDAACAHPDIQDAIAKVIASFTSADCWEVIQKEVQKNRNGQARTTIARACCESKSANALPALHEFLKDSKNPAAQISALRGIADRKDRSSFEPVKQLIESKDIHERVMAAAIDVLPLLHDRDPVVEVLINALRKAKDLAREPIREALVKAFNGKYDMQYEPNEWEGLWRTVQTAEKTGGGAASSGIQMPPPRFKPPYYGIPLSSLRVVFVIDCSGSMAEPLDPIVKQKLREEDVKKREEIKAEITGGEGGTVKEDNEKRQKWEPLPWDNINNKLDLAKAELVRAINQLPSDVQFAVVCYHTPVWTLEPAALTLATDRNKQAMVAQVEKLVPGGLTNIFVALLSAMAIHTKGQIDLGLKADNLGEVLSKLNTDPNLVRDGADTIFFLTDGNPTWSHTAGVNRQQGQAVGSHLNYQGNNPNCENEICGDIQRANQVRKIKIHTIGIGKDADIKLLERLAKENGGVFRDTNK